MASNRISSLRSVATSAIVSVGDVLFSFLLAAITGSSVMLAQGLQGFADLLTTIFLLFGVQQSKRQASDSHPLGYGRELFFWVLIASLFAFIFSGGYACYRAIQQLIEGSAIDTPLLALAGLTFGVLTNGYSLYTSYTRLQQRASGKSLWTYIRHSSLVETKMTLLVDAMGTLSAILGFIALTLFIITDNTLFDGLGALVIGALTAMGALLVIFDLHDLLVGRSPSLDTIKRIKNGALSVPGVQDILDLRATSLGSGQILALLEIHFDQDKSTTEIEAITDAIKAAVLAAEPQVSHVQVEVETPA